MLPALLDYRNGLSLEGCADCLGSQSYGRICCSGLNMFGKPWREVVDGLAPEISRFVGCIKICLR